jgi:hypothetical protein
MCSKRFANWPCVRKNNACLSHICRVDFMDKTVKKICEKHGLDKKIVEEIINCSSVKDEKKRLKKISSLLERL